MHQNYYFLKQLAPQLHNKLKGKILVETFSQEKDELVLVFAESVEEDILKNPFFIKATLRSNFACLSFPDKFDRARRNSVNLFTDFYGRKVLNVRVFLNERALEIKFRTETLVFKLFGNRSNLIAYNSNGEVTELFNNKLAADNTLKLSNLDRHLDQSYEAFVENDFRFEPLFPTFGKLVNVYLKGLLSPETVQEKRWGIIQSVLRLLNGSEFYLIKIDLVPVLSLISVGEVVSSSTDPIEALNAFYYSYIRLNGVEKEKAEIIRILKKRIQQTEHYLENTFKKLLELEEAVRNDEVANILMANLHQIPTRAESVELFDFYREQPIRIKLKEICLLRKMQKDIIANRKMKK